MLCEPLATRRDHLKAILALAGAIGAASSSLAAGEPGKAGLRLPTIDDYLSLEALETVRTSPDGRWAAVEISRSMSSPHVPGDPAADLRSDIWLLDLHTGGFKRLTDAAATGASAWFPIWSPDSATLAVLTNIGSLGPRPAFVDIGDGVLRVCGEDPVSVHANFGTHGAWRPDRQIWGVWCNAMTFLAVLLGPDETNVWDELGDPGRLYDPLWAKTRKGELSVTTWDSRNPVVCRAGARLVALDPRQAAVVRTLVQGSVRAVSLSPDRKFAAVVRATSPKPPPPPEQAVDWVLGGNGYDLDLAVETELSLYSFADVRWLGRVPGVSDLGFADRRQAQWSPSGDFLAVPTYQAASQTSLVHRVHAPSLKVDTFEARGPLDAEFLAALIARAEAASSAERWADRLDLTHEHADYFPLVVPGAVLSFDGDDLAVAMREALVAVDDGGRSQQSIDLGGAAIRHWRPPSSPTRIATFSGPQGPFAVKRVARRLERRRLVAPPEPGAEVWAVAAQGDLLWAETRQAARLWVSGGERAPRLAVKLNPVLDRLWAPRAQRFEYRQADGAPAVGALLLPPSYTPEGSYPLVVHGYASLGARLERDAALTAGNVHRVLLCAKGYVVAIPALPTVPGSGTMEPLDHFAAQVETFVEALLQRRLATKGRIGFFGHSYGGFTALAVEARSSLVNAVVAYAPFADLISYHDIPFRDYERDACAPGIARYHESEYEAPNARVLRMGGPPETEFAKYVRNSPRFQFHKGSPPLLMIQGEFDAAGFSQVDASYMALSRLGVPIRVARYWGEGHEIESPANLRNVQAEIERWFETYLGKPA